jgi:ribosomal-protein-alanine N-acetyltransferase
MLALQTKRMTLQALTVDQLRMALDDVDALAADLRICISPQIFSEDSRQAMTIKISRMEHNDLRMHPWFTYFLLIRAEDRTAMGVCGFKGMPNVYGAVELGYAIHEDFRNSGMMTEAVQALVEWAFTQEICLRVTAETLHDNFASQRVLTKVGLALERSGGNMLYWKVDREEWEQRVR